MTALFEISTLHWLVFCLLNGLLLMAAYCVSCRFSGLTFSAVLVATGLIYLSAIIVIVLFFGVLVRSFNPWLIGISSALLSVLVLFFQWRNRYNFWANIGRFLQQMWQSRDPWFMLFFAILLVQLLFMLAKVFIVPVHVLDSMAYRAVPAPMWYQLGYIPAVLDVPVNEVNGRSLSIALLMLWYFLFLGSDHLVNLPQYLVSIILIVLVYAMARQCGVSRAWSFKASVLVYFMPVVLMQSISTQDHLAVNVAFLASLYYLKACFEHKTLRFMPLLGVSVGLMFAFKNNAVIYMPVLLGLGLWLLYSQRKYLFFSQPVARMFSILAARRLFMHVLLAVFLAVLVGGYWTAKNIAVYNNPFGLLMAKQIGLQRNPAKPLADNELLSSALDDTSVLEQSLTKRDSLSMLQRFVRGAGRNLQSNLGDFFYRVSDVGKELYMPTLENIAAFGPQFFVFGLMALAALLLSIWQRCWRMEARLYAAVAVAMLLLYFCVMDTAYAYRNFLFFPVLMLVYFFSLTKPFLKKGGLTTLSNISIHAVVLISIIWCIFFTALPSNVNPLTLKEFAWIERHYQSPARYIRQMGSLSQVMRRMDEIPPDAAVAYVNSRQRNSWNYAFYDVQWQRAVSYIPLSERYFQCDEASLTCTPLPAFKKRLRNESISFVNFCFLEACLSLSDPGFFEVGKGLYYFKHGIETR